MPPRPPPNRPKAGLPSKSRELVLVGPREVVKKHHGRERDENGNKPLTARAIILRHGKYGAMGTGEVVLAYRMSGREKLDLLAEDLMRLAVAAPFKLDVCLKIADSQLSSYLDEIRALQDHEFFYDRIKAAVASHLNPARMRDLREPLKMRAYVVAMVASHIHNTYMMASGWRVVGDIVRDLIDDGLDDAILKAQLKAGPSLRSRFLVLYDTVNILVQAGQNNFAILATASPRYSQYFKIIEDPDTNENEYVFSWDAVKAVHKSFLDSLIVELCLPSSSISKQILYQLLGEAMEETPGDAKKFSQALWDAVGDLSAIVELQAMLEGVLRGQEGGQWKMEPRQMPEEYEAWVDAQILSKKASDYWDTYAGLIYPLEQTKKKAVLDQMWAQITENYQAVCGKTPDLLWRVDDIRNIKPYWHGRDLHHRANGDDARALVPSNKRRGGRTLPAITNGEESDGSMPSLQTVSDSSGEEPDDEEEDDTDDREDGSDDNSEDDYDTDEEDDLRDLLREAMDTAVASSDFYNPKGPAPEFDALAGERKSNPFLKLLGSLRGRMFAASPTLSTTTRTEPRQHYPARKPGMASRTAASPKAAPNAAKSTSAASQKPRQTTVEEVEDEEALTATVRKKKKKPKKKKPTSASVPHEDTPPAPAPTPVSQPTSPTSPKVPAARATSPPATPKKGPPIKAKPSPAQTTKSPPARPSFSTGSTTTLPFGSTTSLPLQTEPTAQSAHKYLQTEGLIGGKPKVKTRAAVGNLTNLDSIAEKSKKKRFWSAFSKKGKNDEESDEEELNVKEKKGRWTGLSRKTSTLMHQLLRTSQDKTQGLADMRWDKFVKLMEGMGFTYVPYTAGSRVRFDPPDPKDRPIVFHKPHPDPMIHPIKLKDFAKKLKQYYGWNEDEFLRATQGSDDND